MLCHDICFPETGLAVQQTALMGAIGDAVPECCISIFEASNNGI
jgi:hypothetical protein